MKKITAYMIVFVIGAIAYSMLEILWRGYTHISMALAGGICLVGLYYLENTKKELSLLKKCIIGAFFITFVEFSFGCVVNKLLGLGVWDYSDRFLDLMGQICPLYTLLWFIITIPALGLCKTVNRIIEIMEDRREKS
ncbi:MAG: hypothetical protein E7591_03765 [Ruminococcaceae bacterium]|nr:hypothetical protein [Oscillospiraceae bacterium]